MSTFPQLRKAQSCSFILRTPLPLRVEWSASSPDLVKISVLGESRVFTWDQTPAWIQYHIVNICYPQ